MRRALLKAFNYVSEHLKFSIYKACELASLSKYWLRSSLGNSLAILRVAVSFQTKVLSWSPFLESLRDLSGS